MFLLVFAAAAFSASAYAAHRSHPRPLTPSRFAQSTLVHSVNVSPDTKLLTLSLPPQLIPLDPRIFAPIWSIFIKDSDIQVERPYTPLEGIDGNGHIKLWVKKYERGEVGRWLHARQVGDPIEIRGPVKTWSRLWQEGQWDQVVLARPNIPVPFIIQLTFVSLTSKISGGTGITPFHQLLHSVFRMRDTSFNTRFTLLHSSKSLADLPPSDVIQPLATLSQEYPDRFQMHLFAESVDGSHPLNIQRGRIGKSVIQDTLRLTHTTPWWRRLFGSSEHAPFPPDKRILVLVCGPEGYAPLLSLFYILQPFSPSMVSTIAGPYGRNYSQGEVGGILGELGLKSQHVWKL